MTNEPATPAETKATPAPKKTGRPAKKAAPKKKAATKPAATREGKAPKAPVNLAALARAAKAEDSAKAIKAALVALVADLMTQHVINQRATIPAMAMMKTSDPERYAAHLRECVETAVSRAPDAPEAVAAWPFIATRVMERFTQQLDQLVDREVAKIVARSVEQQYGRPSWPTPQASGAVKLEGGPQPAAPVATPAKPGTWQAVVEAVERSNPHGIPTVAAKPVSGPIDPLDVILTAARGASPELTERLAKERELVEKIRKSNGFGSGVMLFVGTGATPEEAERNSRRVL